MFVKAKTFSTGNTPNKQQKQHLFHAVKA